MPEFFVNAMQNMKNLCFRSSLKLLAFVFASFCQASFAGINSGEPDLSTKLHSVCAADAAKMFRDREAQIQEIIKTIGGSPDASNAGVVKGVLAYPPFEISRETAQAILDFEVANPGYNLRKVFKETRDEIYRQIKGDVGNTNRFAVKYPDADILKVAIANLKRLKTFREELVALALDPEVAIKLEKIATYLRIGHPQLRSLAFIESLPQSFENVPFPSLTLTLNEAIYLEAFASKLRKEVREILNGKKMELPEAPTSHEMHAYYFFDLSKQSLVARFPDFSRSLVFPESFLPASGSLALSKEDLDKARLVFEALEALEFLQRYPMDRLDSDLKNPSSWRD